MAKTAAGIRPVGRPKKTGKPKKCVTCRKENAIAHGLCMSHYQEVRRMIQRKEVADWGEAEVIGLCVNRKPSPARQKLIAAKTSKAK